MNISKTRFGAHRVETLVLRVTTLLEDFLLLFLNGTDYNDDHRALYIKN